MDVRKIGCKLGYLSNTYTLSQSLVLRINSGEQYIHGAMFPSSKLRVIKRVLSDDLG